MDILLTDLVLRGASTGILAIVSILLLIAPVSRATKTSWLLLAISHSCRQWGALPDELLFDATTAHILRVIGAATAIFSTWFLVTVFVETRRFAWLWVVSSCVIFAGLLLVPSFIEISTPLRIFGALHYCGLCLTILSLARDDLLNRRRIARLAISVLIVLNALFLAVFARHVVPGDDIMIPFVTNVLFLPSIVVFGIWLLRVDVDNAIGQSIAPATVGYDPAQNSDRQRALTRKIEIAMQGGIWRNEGLTVAKLAAQVGAPEYQVRKAINQLLGYRNFSSFINQARIEAAKKRLATPSEATVSIQEIAYDVGFSSLGPFNRAFRDATNLSPSEFRASHGADILVDSEKT